jgi:hypothetical protein
MKHRFAVRGKLSREGREVGEGNNELYFRQHLFRWGHQFEYVGKAGWP